MTFYIFSFFLLLLTINYTNLEIHLKFRKYNSLYFDFFSLNLEFFVKYYLENTFYTEILLGNPSQKIEGFLNPEQSAFYLTSKSCQTKSIYYSKNSNDYKIIENITTKYYNIFRFSDSLIFDNVTKGENNKCKIDNYEIFADCEIDKYLCFIIGTKLVSFGEEIKDNLLSRLHANNYIKSYYFTFDTNQRNDDEMIYIFDLNINENNNEYTFIKTSSYTDKNREYLVWGLDFENLFFDDNKIYENPLRAEFNINLGCIMASSSFREHFNKFLTSNNIIIEESNYRYMEKYYIYIFDENYYDKLKNFTLDFYHKELNFHFILDYKDLFYEKYDKIYCLIVFSYKEKNFWKFGWPFFKKYNFIYNQDSKFIGFLASNKKQNNVTTDNNGNNLDNDKRYLKINGKLIVFIIVIFLFILVSMIFFGILIGKNLNKVRKNKTNELLELYDYNSKTDKNK